MIVDVVILVLALAYAGSGYRNGALIGAFSLLGFAGGALVGAQFARPVSDAVGNSSLRIPVAVLCVVGTSLIGQLALVRIGQWLRTRVRSRFSRRVDAFGGAVLGVVAVLFVTWVLAVPLASSSSPALSAQVRASRIVKAVAAAMPSQVQQVYSSLRSTIDRSGFPSVFGDLGGTPKISVADPDSALAADPVVARVRGSVMKIESVAPSCHRGLEGSGFVFAPHRVMTNAHVVAGADRVQVDAPEQGQLDARVIEFDPESDVAVLYVPDLTATPMNFAPGEAAAGADAIVLGYPLNRGFDVEPARVADTLRATGRDIYDQNSVTRSVYSIRALVRSGNSGGPLIDRQGRVLGVVFATALDVPNTGFVLTAGQVAPAAATATATTARASTGACTSE